MRGGSLDVRLIGQEVQYVFERHVGPVAQCTLTEDCASIAFVSPEYAQASCVCGEQAKRKPASLDFSTDLSPTSLAGRHRAI